MERPKEIRDLAEKRPPFTCYRGAPHYTPNYHYLVIAYSESGGVLHRDGSATTGPTLRLQHIPSRQPDPMEAFRAGTEVFGVSPDDIVPCGCLTDVGAQP